MIYEIHYSDKNGDVHTVSKASLAASEQFQKHIEATGGHTLHVRVNSGKAKA